MPLWLLKIPTCLLQFEFVFPYFAIYTSWQLKECLLAPPQCHFGCSKLVAQSYHTALGSVPWLHKEMREGERLGAAQIFKTKSFIFFCNKSSLSCSLHICQDLLQDICQSLLILCLHVDSMLTGCLMWEVSALRERSGFTVLRESPPSFSASRFPAMISSLPRMRRWTGNQYMWRRITEEGFK